MEKQLKITLVKSTIGSLPKQRKTIEAFGLKRLNRAVIKKDNDATRGMIAKVAHLVKVEEV